MTKRAFSVSLIGRDRETFARRDVMSQKTWTLRVGEGKRIFHPWRTYDVIGVQ
jgi:hypothetical protein